MSLVLWTEIIAASFCIVLGVFTFVKNPTSTANRGFALFNISLAAWVPSDFMKFIPNHQSALTCYRLIYIGGSLIPFAFLMFMWAIAGYKRSKGFHLTKWTAIAFALLSQTSLMIKDITLTQDINNPIDEVHGPLYNIFMIYYVVSLLYSIKPLIFGYSESSGLRRKQMQHIMFAFFLGFVAVLNFFANTINNKIPQLFYLFIVGISATFAVAILKHRLMDITVIIRKTIIYTAVTAALVVMYLLAISLFAHSFQGFTGLQTIFSSGVAAGLIAFVFQPLSKRVQMVVDRKFFRQYVDRDQKLYELSREVITHTTPEAMAQALTHVLQETLHPKTGALYLKSKDANGFVPAAAWGNTKLENMPEDNILARYFLDHPQPFVQEVTDDLGTPHDTRNLNHKERNAA